MNGDHLITADIEFDTLDHLNLSLEKLRIVLDNFVSQNKISKYYVMRYSPAPIFLGVKFILISSDFKAEVVSALENTSKSILGFIGIRKIEQGNNLNSIGQDSFLASIGMMARNEIFDLLKRKPSEEELLYFFHYLCNPLEMDYRDEATFCSYLLFKYLKEGKIK